MYDSQIGLNICDECGAYELDGFCLCDEFDDLWSGDAQLQAQAIAYQKAGLTAAHFYDALEVLRSYGCDEADGGADEAFFVARTLDVTSKGKIK